LLLPAEFIGLATLTDGVLDIGGVEVRFNVGWPNLAVYVRRDTKDLSVVEVELAIHDGLEEEELEMLNMEAERYPLGPKEYWRSKMVGRYTIGADSHPMTDDDFETDWADGQ
jgi:hypothetical protein